MLVFLFFVCTTTLSYAQHMVSGVVKDVTGEPIIGANVVEKGTTNGSITDIDGKFSFSISKPVVTLSVSLHRVSAARLCLQRTRECDYHIERGLAELGRSRGCRLRCGQEAGLDRFGCLREGREVAGDGFFQCGTGVARKGCGVTILSTSANRARMCRFVCVVTVL